MITIIAAIGKNNELGMDNKLLWSIPEDMKHFRSYTQGKKILMGRKTFESIGKPLPDRKSIVVSSNNILVQGIIVEKTVDEALQYHNDYGELVIIGGGTIYHQTIDRVDKLVITHVDIECRADTYFPIIDKSVWKVNNSVDGTNNQYNYKIVEYIRNASTGNS